MDTPEHRVQLIQAESARLGHYLHALPPDAWRRPSACHRWEVRDVVGHLILGAELYHSVISRGLQGNIAPLEGLPQAGTVNAASASPLIDQLSVARRESLGDQLLATFEATDQALNRLLADLIAPDWETPCYHLAGLLPVRCLRDFRLGELVIHGWDIRSRFESNAPLSPESLPVLLDVLTTPITCGWAFWPGAPRSTPARYRFTVTGRVPSTLDITVAGEQAHLTEGGDVRPDVTFRCEAEAYVLVRYGRLGLADALATGRVVAEGDQALAAAFGQWFRGI